VSKKKKKKKRIQRMDKEEFSNPAGTATPHAKSIKTAMIPQTNRG
jgi:hypothetical protein